jgi:hypothetical protein
MEKKVRHVRGLSSGNFESFSNKIDIDKLLVSKTGFYNAGGSCYMASIIQILIHLKPFLEYYLKFRTNSPLCNKFNEFLQKVQNASANAIEIRDLANTYYSINSRFKGTKGNNPMTFFIEFIEDLGIDNLFTGIKNIQIKQGKNIMQCYDEKFIFHMVTLDKTNQYIDLVSENIKELENDKNCTITEKLKIKPEILVINLEIDNMNINFEDFEKIPVADSENECIYYLKGINKYSNYHSISIININDSWYKFDDYKCMTCNTNEIFTRNKFINYIYNLFYEKGEPIER